MRRGLVVCILLFLIGCSGGGTRSSGTPAPPPGPSHTGSLSLRISTRPEAQPRGILSTILVRIVDANQPELDVIDAVSIPVGGSATFVQQRIDNIPLGLRRIILISLDDEALELGRSISEPIHVTAGINQAVILTAPIGQGPTPTPTPTPPDVNQLRFRTQPSGTLVNQPIAPPVEVELLDSSGNLLASGTDAVTLSLTGSGNLSGGTTVNAVDGVATFPSLTVDQAGTGFTLTASADGFTPATSSAFDIASSVGPPAQLVFITQPANTNATQVIAPPVQVVVQDSNGITVPTASATVDLALGANPGAATLSGTLSVVPNNGVATFPDLSLDRPAAGYTLVASSTGLPSATSNPFIINNPATQLAFGTQPATGQARKVLGAFTVEVHDVSGNLVPSANDPVTLSLAANPGPSTLSGTLTVNAVNGVATFSNVTLSKSGTGYTLIASAPGLTSAVSNTFDQTFPRGYIVDNVPGSPFGGLNQPRRGSMSRNGLFLYIGNFNGVAHVIGYSVDQVTGALALLPSSPFGTLGAQVAGFRVAPSDDVAVATNAASNNLTRFTLDNTTGALGGATLAGTGANPLDLVIRPGTPQYCYAVNYNSGSITGIDLGTMLATPNSPYPVLNNVVAVPQYATIHPNNNILVCSTGNVFSINPGTGELTEVPGSPFATANASSSEFNPAGTFLYSAAGNNGLAVHSIDPLTGFLTPIAGSPFTVPGRQDAVRVVLNGEFLYTFSGPAQEVHIFALDPVSGVPTEIDDSPVSTLGNFDLIQDPFDRFLYITNTTNLVYGYTIVP